MIEYEKNIYFLSSRIYSIYDWLIIRDLLTGVKRYNQLTRSVVGISAKVLTENLRELENDGIIERKVYPEIPPKVEYFLTDKGNELRPILDLIKNMRMFHLK